MTAATIAPGSTIGVLGGGQLGRMFAMAARRLGYRVHTLAPEHDTPTGQIADVEIVASYDDLDQVRRFARGVDVVTFEFENVPAAAAAAAEAEAVVRPSGRALDVAQHRIREKRFLSTQGAPVAPYAEVRSAAGLVEAVARLGRPAVLKTAAFGYDGKGQVTIGPDSDPAAAWASLGHTECVLESFIDLACEISVIGARAVDGTMSFFEPFDNTHRHHILDLTVAPADIPASLGAEAREVARAVLEGLDYIGILCIEFFVTRDGRLLVNEIAPRPHNSGHLTFDACRTSQFEQQVRAICGFPLGATDLLQPAAMVNLLGDLWAGGEPRWAAALAMPDVKVHLYGKAAARAGRKMGHLTVLAPTREQARDRALAARSLLTARGGD
ncbi:MAG TPA: 5-(carboxyamino)imidazole ribonucleotide synthase [Vicinamibacterales bacterium]|nr:5-(carboxyamino)imidazole ribonucleotide synthase [Vicinamibacterales bacterium]